MFALSRSSDELSAPAAQARSFQAIVDQAKNGRATLLDVRTPAEYAAGHFASAVSHDSVDITAGKLPNLPEDAHIYLYCRSGNRSAAAKSALEKAGYTHVIDLGGLADVQKIGGKLQK